jgi:beta-glucosidase
MSDYGATHSTVDAANHGLDCAMGNCNQNSSTRRFEGGLKQAVLNNQVSMEVLDNKVRRQLRAKYIIGAWDEAPKKYEEYWNSETHREFSYSAGLQSITLLKNEDGLLPLDKSNPGKVAVIGPFASEARYSGSGSSEVVPLSSVSPREGIADKIGSNGQVVSDYNGADVAIVCVGVVGEKEDQDRETLTITSEGDQLVKAVMDAGVPCVVVYTGGSASIAGHWSDAEAVVCAFYPGQEQGRAIADVIFGDHNPTGHLPVTFPKTADQLPPFTLEHEPAWEARGYRYFDYKNLTPLFAFGHGLCYTTFEYSTPHLSHKTMRTGDSLRVTVDISNTGERAGEDVVQLYLSDDQSTLKRTVKDLKAFGRVVLEPGETKPVTMVLTQEDLQYYDDQAERWIAEPGSFTIHIGASATDIRSSATFTFAY